MRRQPLSQSNTLRSIVRWGRFATIGADQRGRFEFIAEFANAAVQAVDLAPLRHDHLVQICNHPVLRRDPRFKIRNAVVRFLAGHAALLCSFGHNGIRPGRRHKAVARRRLLQ